MTFAESDDPCKVIKCPEKYRCDSEKKACGEPLYHRNTVNKVRMLKVDGFQ